MTRHLRLLVLALVALACSTHTPEPAPTRTVTPLVDCFTPVPAGNITGFGFDGQPRNLSLSGGGNVRGALDLLVNDLGANFARVEVFDGQTDWESTPDNSDPAVINWDYFDAVFSAPRFQRLWAYVAYLNQLGVAHVELAQHGGIPLWMGTNTPPAGSTQTSYHGPADGRAYVLTPSQEDEFVETCVAMLLYARTRAPQPRPHFDLFSPWNEPEFAGLGEGIDIPTAQRERVLNKLVTRMNALPDLAGIQLVVGEDGSEPGMIETRGAVQGDSLVMARTAATSFHRYSDADVWTQWNNASPPAWVTELNSPWLASCYVTTWTMGLQAAGNLISALQNGVTAGLAWSDYDAPHSHQNNTLQTFGLLEMHSGGQTAAQLCPDGFSDAQPSDTVLDAMTYTPKPTYWALRHAFKWIRPNASRIAASDSSSSVDLVAYLNADGTVAVFGRNTGSTANVTVTLTMQSPPSYLTPRVSTSTSTDVVGSAVPLTNGQGVFSLPAQSVFTLLSSPGSGGSGGSGGTGGSGGMGGMSSGGAGAGGAASGAGGQGGMSGSISGSDAGGQSGSGGVAGADQGGMSGAGGASAGSGGGSGQGGAGGGAGGAGAGGVSGAGAGGAAGQAGSGGTGGLPGLVAAWEFDEGTGTSTSDASGHGHTGTIASGVTWVTSGCKFGACLSFPGTSGKNVTVADANDLDLGANFTVMAWVLPTTTSGWRPVLIKENSGSTEAYLLYSNPSGQGAYFTDSNSTEWSTTGTGNVSTSQWSHVAMTKNGTTLSYWVNGSVVGSTSASALAVKTSSGILAIGGHTFWNGEWFSGKLDDVRCANVAYSQTQIQQVMTGAF